MKNTRFCQNLLSFFDKKCKAIVNLIIALAFNNAAKSVTELALHPAYFYQYSSICDAIDAIFKHKNKDTEIELILQERLEFDKKTQIVFKDILPPKWNGKYRLLNIDVTPIARAYSPTLENRGFVHAANNVISSNKPITIGINMSTIGLCARENEKSWNLPLSMLKVPIDMKSGRFAALQLETVVANTELFSDDLFVSASDSAYSNRNFMYPNYEKTNLINIARIAGHRNVFLQFKGEQHPGSGAHTKYGEVFKLKDSKTHPQPDKTDGFEVTLKKNQRKCYVKVNQWNDMIISGSRTEKMNDKPFNLISINVFDAQTNQPVFAKTLWLTVWNQRRNKLSLKEIYDAFRLRFDIEFFFRFGKQRLLLDKFQTPENEHLENWFNVVKYAYWLLYLSRNESENSIRKWEKYLPECKNQDVKEPEIFSKTPTQTQRAGSGIINEFAKNNLIPKIRNNSSGRKKGDKQTPRTRFEVVKKGKNTKI